MLDPSELPSMLATLNSYEAMFGPYHTQTLALTLQIARALWSAGEARTAQRLAEHSMHGLTRGGHQASSLRVTALTTLRDLLREQGDAERAIAVQREIVECVARIAGPDDPQTTTQRSDLAGMLLSAGPDVAAA